MPRRPTRLRQDLRAIVGDGVAFSLMVGVGEAYVPAFVLAAGHGDIAAGLVATVPMLAGACFQLVTPAGVRALHSHKRWVVLCAALQALSLFPLASGALAGGIAVGWIFAVVSAYWSLGMATSPAWNTWVGTLVPRRLRAHFFARRTMWSHAALMIGVVAGGAQLHAGPALGNPLAVFALPFAAAALARLVSAGFLSAQSEPRPDLAPRPLGARDFLVRLRDGVEGKLLLYLLAMQATVHIAASFFTPYMLGPLGFSYAQFTSFTVAPFLARILVLPALGRLARRYGTQRLLWVGALGTMPLPALWLVSQSFSYLMGVQVLAGMAWGALELAMLLAFFERIDERHRTGVLAFFNLASAFSMAAGTVVGALLLKGLGGGEAAYLTLFLVSSGGRALALGLLRRVPPLPKPEAELAMRTLAVRPSAGAVQRPILASGEPGEVALDGSGYPDGPNGGR